MGAWITIEISAGTSIERACEDAHRVANRLGINCEFDFNSVRCFAVPQGSAELLAARQQEEQCRKLTGPYDRHFASSDPRWRPRQPDPKGDAQNQSPSNPEIPNG